jgi:hypothetical protein
MDNTPLDPRPLVTRRMIWDIYPHAYDQTEIQKRLGLTPDSQDGLDMDHKASEIRHRATVPLHAVLAIMSECAGNVMTDMLMQEMLDAVAEEAAESGEEFDELEIEFEEGYVESFAEQNTQVIFHSALAIIGQLLANGLLAYGEAAQQ